MLSLISHWFGYTYIALITTGVPAQYCGVTGVKDCRLLRLIFILNVVVWLSREENGMLMLFSEG